MKRPDNIPVIIANKIPVKLQGKDPLDPIHPVRSLIMSRPVPLHFPSLNLWRYHFRASAGAILQPDGKTVLGAPQTHLSYVLQKAIHLVWRYPTTSCRNELSITGHFLIRPNLEEVSVSAVHPNKYSAKVALTSA